MFSYQKQLKVAEQKTVKGEFFILSSIFFSIPTFGNFSGQNLSFFQVVPISVDIGRIFVVFVRALILFRNISSNLRSLLRQAFNKFRSVLFFSVGILSNIFHYTFKFFSMNFSKIHFFLKVSLLMNSNPVSIVFSYV